MQNAGDAAPLADMKALWDMLLKSEELARAAAAEDRRPPLLPDDAASLTSLCIGIAKRFKAHAKVNKHARLEHRAVNMCIVRLMPHASCLVPHAPASRTQANEPSLGARARDALRTLLFSFVLSTLKARLCRADLFPGHEGLQLFCDELRVPRMPPAEPNAPTDGAGGHELRSVRAAGKAQLGLWLCDWGGCTNMEGPSELKLVAKLCPGRCELTERQCSQRYCSRPCQAAALGAGHKLKCPTTAG
jgi:hypothetical protein